MKKAVFAFVVAALMFVLSCNKGPAGGGSWTFRGQTFTATNCIAIGNYLAATNSSNTNSTSFGGVTVFFPGTTLPKDSGTYTVVDTLPVGNQVSITASVGGAADSTFSSIGGSGQTVAVSISHGKVAVSGTNILLQDTLFAPGIYTLSFNIYNN